MHRWWVRTVVVVVGLVVSGGATAAWVIVAAIGGCDFAADRITNPLA